VVVTIPEEMAVAETLRLLTTLTRLSIPVRNLVVNHVYEGGVRCPFCQLRRAQQVGLLGKIEREFANLYLLKVPQLPYEVRGVEQLSRFAQFLTGVRPATIETRASTVQVGPFMVSKAEPSSVSSDGLLLPISHFVLVGGKGGVGKSVVAAATALKLASQFPQKRILLFSTGAAHSLTDSFDQKIGAEITAIEGYHNLYAREIDAVKRLDDFKRQYREAIDEIFNSFLGGRGVKVEYDQKVLERLFDISPPGLDEVMALMEVMEQVERHEFDIFVLDTAPTGHLIRFLEMPDIVRNWLTTTTKMLLKYRGVVRLGAVADLVLKYSRLVRKLRKQLLDATDTEFIAVTIPEAMGVVQMERLLQALSRFRVACRQIVINMVTPPGDCPFCSMKRGEEQGYIGQVVASHPDFRVVSVPRLPHPVRGLKSLLELGQILYSEEGERQR
jgi:arsenite-transporting ATPase